MVDGQAGGGEESESGDRRVFTRRLDTDREEPAIEVAEVVAALEGVEVTSLPSVYDTVDHLLTHLFGTPPSHDARANVEFSYAGYRITVHQGGEATFVKLS